MFYVVFLSPNFSIFFCCFYLYLFFIKIIQFCKLRLLLVFKSWLQFIVVAIVWQLVKCKLNTRFLFSFSFRLWLLLFYSFCIAVATLFPFFFLPNSLFYKKKKWEGYWELWIKTKKWKKGSEIRFVNKMWIFKC